MLDEVTALSTFALVIRVCSDKIIIVGKDYPDCPHVPATELAVGTPEEKWWRDALEGFYKRGGPSDVTINKRLLLQSSHTALERPTPSP